VIVLGELDFFVWGGFEATDRQLVAEVFAEGNGLFDGTPRG